MKFMNLDEFERILLKFMLGAIELDETLSLLSSLKSNDPRVKNTYEILLLLNEGKIREFFRESLKMYYHSNYKNQLDTTSQDRFLFLLALDSILPFVSSLREIYYVNRIRLLKDLIVGVDRGYNLWKALGKTKKAIDLQKIKGYIFGILGIELVEMKKYDEAASYLLEALKIHKAFNEIDFLKVDIFNIAVCMLEMKRYDDAIAYLKEYESYEEDLTVKKYLGIAYFLKKEYPLAKEIFEEILEKYDNENQSEIIYYLAFTNFAGYLEGTISNGLEKGNQYIETLLGRGTYWTLNALFLRGTLYFLISEYEKASDDFADAISILIDYYNFKNKKK